MKIFRTLNAFQSWRASREGCAGSLGFVPTLGGLHLGHRFLLDRAQEENDRVVVSIFCNPTQFNDPKDLENYPSKEEQDLELVRECRVDGVLMPSVEELYPDAYQFRVVEASVSQQLEGVSRPGHFNGVLTVVLKLLNLVRADRAYFGKKDYQQLVLVQRLVEAFFIPTQIIPCVTIRDGDGLALSSRNARLSAHQREKAGFFPKILKEASTPEWAREQLKAHGFEVEYVEEWNGRILGAVKLGEVRLIDNFPLKALSTEAENEQLTEKMT